jgi:hypothetical protein
MQQETFQRMLDEYKELTEKTTKCRNFILNKEEFEKIDMLNRDLLIAQLKAMETYLSLLSIRLGVNGKVAEEADSEESVKKENTEAPAQEDSPIETINESK